MTDLTDKAATAEYLRRGCNRSLALAIREVARVREGSWVDDRYTISNHSAIRQVVGDDPIAVILDCLFTAGFADVWDFCDTVLGKAE